MISCAVERLGRTIPSFQTGLVTPQFSNQIDASGVSCN